VALNGARNAGILAAQIIGSANDTVAAQLDSHKAGLADKVINSLSDLTQKGFRTDFAE
jgi:5-(carboxyamino)imidazole ribonucleotide mutase